MKWFDLFEKHDAKTAESLLILKNKDLHKKMKKLAREKYDATLSQFAKYKLSGSLPKNCKNCGCSMNIGGPVSFCSSKCSNSSPETQNKKKKTVFKRYGVESVQQSPVVRKKIEETCMRNHGVRFPQQSKKIRKKTVRNNLKKYGVENSSQRKDVQEKREKTFLLKYGVSNPMFVPEIAAKAALRSVIGNTKKSVTIAGKKFSYMGYEHIAIEFLVKKGVKTSSIVQSQRVVQYEINGNAYNYIPDLEFIHKGTTRIVEVKSLWTSGVSRKDVFLVVRSKARSVVDLGLSFLLMVIPSKKDVVIFNDFHKITFKEFKSRLAPFSSYR